MDQLEFFTLLASLIGMFFWNRSESRADVRQMDTKLDAYRMETNARLDSYRQETLTLIRAIQEEMKDFHHRLCDIKKRS